MTEQQLIQMLIAANVSEGRIHPIEAPGSATKPYTIYSVLRGPLTSDLDGDQGDEFTYMFTTWCNSYAESEQTIRDFREKIQAHGHVSGKAIIDKDPDTESFRIINNNWNVINI